MNFISTPFDYSKTQPGAVIKREIDDEETMITNLLELIVFTPRGSFPADPEFGFDYWNHEYANIEYDSFNKGQGGLFGGKAKSSTTKADCQSGIQQNLLTYAPQLTHVTVELMLNPATDDCQKGKHVQSKHLVSIKVEGIISDGIGTRPYSKKIEFLMEPTAKHRMYR